MTRKNHSPKKTTIQISVETRRKLEKLKLTKRETMDEVINRLLQRASFPAAVGSAAKAGEGPRLNAEVKEA